MAQGLDASQQQAFDDVIAVGFMSIGQAMHEAFAGIESAISAYIETPCPVDCICCVYPSCSGH